ncbi:MAG: hypothetical protein Q9212_004489 [Teloschistes hypoglaucus]
MPKATGQKRQAAQADLDDQNPKGAKSRSNEKAEAPKGTKRITRSSDQSSPITKPSPEDKRKRTSSKNDKPAKETAKDTSYPMNTPNKKAKIIKKGTARPVVKSKKTANPKVTKNASKSPTKVDDPTEATHDRSSSLSGVAIPIKNDKDLAIDDDAAEEDDSDGPSYWLMKAEPYSRIEKGKDVKFSIDDLKNATEPEAWDGVRNPTARNNMRAMMKGDMAFFYHSNCKSPGIVGTMEIVREHSVDASAFDKENPYYDEKSTEDKPKWCVVHVEFRRKFPEMVSLKELKQFAKPGGTLENMQTLKMSRLSVSKVSKKEWNFIHSLLENEDEA